MGEAAAIKQQVEKIRSFSSLPICVGFGIKTAEQAAKVAAFSDGVVIGSHFVAQIPQHSNDRGAMVAALEKAASSMRNAVRKGSV
jgi:tryptophan synthase alpha chain